MFISLLFPKRQHAGWNNAGLTVHSFANESTISYKQKEADSLKGAGFSKFQ
jgi:hypothetical protein